MSGSIIQLVLASVVAGAAGAAVAYFVVTFIGKRRIGTLTQQHNEAIGQITAERGKLVELATKMQAKIGTLQSQSANYQSELEAVLSEKTTASDQHQHQLRQADEQHKRNVKTVNAQNAQLTEQSSQMQAMIGELQKEATTYRDELAAAARDKQTLAAQNKELVGNINLLTEKSKQLVGSVQTLHAERELTKTKVNEMANMLTAVHQRTLALQSEFEKAGLFYKGELTKSFKKRQRLEEEIKAARADEEAFRKRIESSVKEHGSTEEMILNAEARLGQISMLERNVNKLEGERKDLQDEVKQLRLDNEKLNREVGDLVELRIHNEQLVKAVEGLERSRSAHETEAAQARNKAEQSEQLSDTLKMRLSDLQKGFAEMEKEQTDAIEHVRKAAASARPAANQDVQYHEIYDLVPSMTG